MGDRTDSVYAEVELIEGKQEEFIAWLKKPPAYTKAWGKDIAEEYAFLCKRVQEEIKSTQVFEEKASERMGNLEIVFSDAFMQLKIVGYWYAGTLAFFRDLAQYIEGTIEIQSDAGEAARLEFSEGRVTYEFQSRLWSDPVYAEDEFKELPELPDSEKVIRGL